MIRPSSLPVLSISPLFESSGSTDYTRTGTARHAAYKSGLQGDTAPLDALPDEDRDGVAWAIEQTKFLAPSNQILHLEERGHFTGPNFELITGTPDAHSTDPTGSFDEHLFDLKWRFDSYELQMFAYCLMKFEQAQPPKQVVVHLLFGQAQKVYTFTVDESVRDVIDDLINRAKAATRCNPSKYCCRCSKLATCREYLERVEHIAAGREWELREFHSSQIQDPEEMGKALRLARMVAKWAESVEANAKLMVQKQGKIPVGFINKPKKGRRFVTSATKAFPLCGLPQEEFMDCCAVRLNTSKTYPDQFGLIDKVAKFTGLKKAPAGRKIEAALGDLITRGKETFSLVSVDGTDEENQQAEGE